MRMLELFAGTHSVSKALGSRVTELVSVDLLPRFGATVTCDILQLDYTRWPPGYFDVVWASPPCTEYSVAKTRAPRRIAEANAVVQRTLEIIEYLQPRAYFLENPATGLLKNQPFMAGRPFVDVDYCQFGFPYRKRTRIWTNQARANRLCDKTTCQFMVDGHHLQAVGGGNGAAQELGRLKKYRIPEQLVWYLFENV